MKSGKRRGRRRRLKPASNGGRSCVHTRTCTEHRAPGLLISGTPRPALVPHFFVSRSSRLSPEAAAVKRFFRGPQSRRSREAVFTFWGRGKPLKRARAKAMHGIRIRPKSARGGCAPKALLNQADSRSNSSTSSVESTSVNFTSTISLVLVGTCRPT